MFWHIDRPSFDVCISWSVCVVVIYLEGRPLYWPCFVFFFCWVVTVVSAPALYWYIWVWICLGSCVFAISLVLCMACLCFVLCLSCLLFLAHFAAVVACLWLLDFGLCLSCLLVFVLSWLVLSMPPPPLLPVSTGNLWRCFVWSFVLSCLGLSWNHPLVYSFSEDVCRWC